MARSKRKNSNRSEYLTSVHIEPSTYSTYYLIDPSKPVGDPGAFKAVKIDRIEPAAPKDPANPYKTTYRQAFLYPADTPYNTRRDVAVAYDLTTQSASVYTLSAAERKAIPSLGAANVIGKVVVSPYYNLGCSVRDTTAPQVEVKRWGRPYMQDAPFQPMLDFEEARRQLFTARILALGGRKLPMGRRAVTHLFLKSLTPGALRAVAVDRGIDTAAAWNEYKSHKRAE